MAKNVLFVCMGNICRSPTAEIIFKQIVYNSGMSKYINVDSAGTHSGNISRLADHRAAMEAKNRGFDISSHKSRPLNIGDFSYFDLIIAMDFENMRFMKEMCPSKDLYKLSMLMRYSKNFFLDEVPDPYYDNLHGFSRVFEYIEDACEGLFNFIYENYSNEFIYDK
ncbi:low molecular weight protein-tyrosine-phosphatase [Candidatus Kinetoplastidibacterium crithidiae]|uniref:Protein-tyrosine phosphatase n=1 Tax=Candidatus Kinetoplastidibacterium crithidiae TCC036E TaxID=1208918 RepID=M1LPD6_9PROT|nr:low molecular weight protein-tyrosine-phosphatase [Candidatus Kinetoplastibacterium crithidii]AFZ82810.1 protein-tyrosine phosphatase [Candidatus Kinetoplastibacterium crithidii (ex Angomonas deanei ATCC 30255)]AGF47537.1 protein-tyrosine phosphatase [Candidatus Kinetoplastibacterium crithidii TCC036E]